MIKEKFKILFNKYKQQIFVIYILFCFIFFKVFMSLYHRMLDAFELFAIKTRGYEDYVFLAVIGVLFIIPLLFGLLVSANAKTIYIVSNVMAQKKENKDIVDNIEKKKRLGVRDRKRKKLTKKEQQEKYGNIFSQMEKIEEEGAKRIKNIMDITFKMVGIIFGVVYIGGFILCVLNNYKLFEPIKIVASAIIVVLCNIVMSILIEKCCNYQKIKTIMGIYNLEIEKATVLVDIAIISAAIAFLSIDFTYTIFLISTFISKYISFDLKVEENTLQKRKERFLAYIGIFTNKDSIFVRFAIIPYGLLNFALILLGPSKYLYSHTNLLSTQRAFEVGFYRTSGLSFTYLVVTFFYINIFAVFYMIGMSVFRRIEGKNKDEFLFSELEKINAKYTN